MSSKSINYSKLNQELDMILSELQSGELDIDAAVEKYQRGMDLVKQLQAYLKEAENKVSKVKATFDK